MNHMPRQGTWFDHVHSSDNATFQALGYMPTSSSDFIASCKCIIKQKKTLNFVSRYLPRDFTKFSSFLQIWFCDLFDRDFPF